MEAYNNRNNTTRETSCGYCRGTGHAITTCPHIKYDYDEWAAYRVPHQSLSLSTNRWFMNDYSYWIKSVNKYYPKWARAQQKKSSPLRVTRSAIRFCGFCSEEGHTRRTCETMANFTTKLMTANANFRQSYYDTIVKGLGIGIGAVVKVKKGSSSYNQRNDPEETMAIVDQFDLSHLNIFSTNGSIDPQYQGQATITVTADTDQFPLDLTEVDTTSRYHSSDARKDTAGRAITSKGGYGYYRSGKYKGTVASSTQPLDESWVSTGALANEFEWLTKKRSFEWLKDRGIDSLVDKWQ